VNISFLLENERGWLSSSLFFYSLEQLGINATRYYIPKGIVLAPEEVRYYVMELSKDLRKAQGKDKKYIDYVAQILTTLNSWGNKNYVVHVV
jgi:hypothetical protein